MPTPRDLDCLRHRLILSRWLLIVAAMTAFMVVLGGLTRLTGSGLSMVEWNPHHFLPPLDQHDWEQAFAGYRASPEFRLVNSGMDLTGYKGIFLLEYLHRLWGRLIGLAFALPLAFFAWKRMIPAGWTVKLAALLVLGGMQGVMGWVMVASGLAQDPQVDHMRLAAHLLLALLILAALIWAALDLQASPPVPAPDLARRIVFGLTLLILTTAVWGAFVAGLHAGKIHNTFPLMDGYVFPPGALPLSPALLNAVETPSAVQYVHRILALTALACLSLTALWAWANKGPKPLVAAGLWAWVQVGMGIAVIVNAAPVALASPHQAGAVVLLGLLIWSLHCLRRP